MDAGGTTTIPLTTVFTPPASCSSSWTYEGSYYNKVSGGILIQNALQYETDLACFPSGFDNSGRGTAAQVFSPGYCPEGYTSPAVFLGGSVTTAVCCQSGFSYYTTLTTIQGVKPVRSVIFAGCISTYPESSPATTLLARANNTDLATTSIEGPLTMWAQAITVAYEKDDLSLFITEASATGTMSATTGAQPTTIIITSTSQPASSATIPGTPPINTMEDESGGLSTGPKAGIGIGVAVGALILLGLAAFFLLRRHKNLKKQQETNNNTTNNNSNNDQYQYRYQNAPTEVDGTEISGPNYAQHRPVAIAEMEQRGNPVPSSIAEMDVTKDQGQGVVRYELQG